MKYLFYAHSALLRAFYIIQKSLVRIKLSSESEYEEGDLNIGKGVILSPNICGCGLDCRLLFEPAPGISKNLYFLSFGKFNANSEFTSIILEL